MPETAAGRPEPINDHERTCPGCQRVIAGEQADFDNHMADEQNANEANAEANYEREIEREEPHA